MRQQKPIKSALIELREKRSKTGKEKEIYWTLEAETEKID